MAKKEEDAAQCADALSPFLLRELSTSEVNVVKTPPCLDPEGKGDTRMVIKARVGEKLLSQEAVQ